ncbi:MAG: hypothetical protein V8R55_12655 [Dysosmobacter sp.]
MVLENPEELDARVYRFPTSSIKQAGRKINYYDFLMAAANRTAMPQLSGWRPGCTWMRSGHGSMTFHF